MTDALASGLIEGGQANATELRMPDPASFGDEDERRSGERSPPAARSQPGEIEIAQLSMIARPGAVGRVPKYFSLNQVDRRNA